MKRHEITFQIIWVASFVILALAGIGLISWTIINYEIADDWFFLPLLAAGSFISIRSGIFCIEVGDWFEVYAKRTNIAGKIAAFQELEKRHSHLTAELKTLRSTVEQKQNYLDQLDREIEQKTGKKIDLNF